MEQHRVTAFLLALVFCLATMLVALNHTSAPPFMDDEDEMVSVDEELDFMANAELKQIKELPEEKPHTAAAEQIVVKDELTAEKKEEPTVTETDNISKTSKEEVTDDETPPLKTLERDDVLTPDQVEMLPEFPGGLEQLAKWLTKQLRYPPVAEQKNIQGKVIVTFVVNTDGSRSHVETKRPVNPHLEREALRVVNLMPAWTPGMINGKPCRTMVAIPIVFKL